MKIYDVVKSSDMQAQKFVQVTVDNHLIETTYVNYHNKHIICFSTQIGCNMGCKFCYSGIMKNFIRNLTHDEIILQINNVLNKVECKDKQILLSAMGIGEPLQNIDNVICVIKHFNHNIENCKFALATIGNQKEALIKLATAVKNINNFKLTISLHSSKDDIRKKLMPSANNISALINNVRLFQKISNKDIEWNYVLFNGINDSISDALQLSELLGQEAYIKLNQFNDVSISKIKKSNNFDQFVNTLNECNQTHEFYKTNGSDINAACGQLVSK